MERKPARGKSPVKRKGKRSYNATGRIARASRTRDTVIDAAEQLFFGVGYGAATIANIADAASVSVETIYKTFGGKPGLVRAIRERRLAGRGPLHAEARSDRASAIATNPHELIAGWGKLTAEVSPLVSPVLLLVRDAAVTDAELAELQVELDGDRLRRMTQNARHLQKSGYLKDGVTLPYAIDVLWTYSAPELYQLLVLKRGWSKAKFGEFVGNAIAAALVE